MSPQPFRRPPLRRRPVAALDIVQATRQALDLKTYDDVVHLLLEEYAERHGILKQFLLLDASSATLATSGKTGKN
jgi:hypothetical protein